MPTLISSDVNGYFRRLGQVKENNRGVLGAEEKLVIIWGMTRGWSKAKTARMIGRSTSPIGRYIHRIVYRPQTVFDDLQLYSQIADRKWGSNQIDFATNAGRTGIRKLGTINGNDQ